MLWTANFKSELYLKILLLPVILSPQTTMEQPCLVLIRLDYMVGVIKMDEGPRRRPVDNLSLDTAPKLYGKLEGAVISTQPSCLPVDISPR